MRLTFTNPCLEFMIGDVRDRLRLAEAMRDSDIVINAAALKHIPVCEAAPWEAVQTNVIGALNVRREAQQSDVTAVISISTDKAVMPVNVLGMTKAMHERIMLLPSTSHKTRFVCVRYGNVLGSSGSVVPLFARQISRGLPILVTDARMTRFLITLDEAVHTVLAALQDGTSGEIWIRRAPAVRITDLAKALYSVIWGPGEPQISLTGIRRGEKIHEMLATAEEVLRTRCVEGFYRIGIQDANRRMPRWERVQLRSDTAHRLEVDAIAQVLRSDGWGPSAIVKGR
jgi:UDP-glucose 4-epimerase